MNTPLTIDEYLAITAPEVWNWDSWLTPPTWPADVFAVAASLLERSGAYAGLGTVFWKVSKDKRKSKNDWERQATSIAQRWRNGLAAGRKSPPKEVQSWWNTLVEFHLLPITSLPRNVELCESLVMLCGVCDEVFEGVGVVSLARLTDPNEPKRTRELGFWEDCMDLLQGGDAAELESNSEGVPDQSWDTQPSLCKEIHPTRVRVLPKAQTPKFGMSIRSLTHYIGLCPSMLMKASWNWHASIRSDIGDHFCNILLLPWPFEVSPRQFAAAQTADEEPLQNTRHPQTGWFTYQPLESMEPWMLANTVVDFLTQAEETIGKVHVVVLPEAALTVAQYERLQTVAQDKGVILISGFVRDEPDGRKTNAAGITFAGDRDSKPVDFEQKKHHRWKLDEDQIVRYSLTGVLNPEDEWWEHISVDDRSLSVFTIREWLCTCALICEDLARLDPAGQFVRALAPDLVIALLFDGPQLATRWPAYYATVLAEDPGSSVLTLTSLGMARLSRPKRHDPNIQNDVIGMWRDIKNGTIEIRLPKGKTAAVLTVQRKQVPVSTADGRRKSVNDLAPIFGGLTYL